MSTLKDFQQEQTKDIPAKKSVGFFDFFKEPPDAPKLEDKELVKKSYAHWRLRMFYSMYIAYVVFYLCRKNISTALPVMSTELGYSNTELGLIGSALYFSYAFGKFINGVLADNSNVRTFLPTALIVSGVANLIFALSASFISKGEIQLFQGFSTPALLLVLAFCWGFNGWFQSMGFPPIAKSLTNWYSNKERGTKWSLWSTSHELGTFLSVILSGFVIAKLGWESAFIVPAVIAIIVSIWLYDRLRDRPESIGLPNIEEYREPESINPETLKENDAEAGSSYIEIFMKHILFNKTIWMLAAAYVFVYIIRYGTIDWIIKYLVEVKHNTLESAAVKLSVLPLVGSVGTISAGFVSDYIFNGKRAPVNVIYLAGVIVSLFAFQQNTSEIMDYVYLSLIGIFTCGPQVLIGGLCAVESSSKKVASAATGFTGSFGYLGAILSGVGTGYAIDNFGWNGAIWFWAVSAIAGIAICLPMWQKGE